MYLTAVLSENSSMLAVSLVVVLLLWWWLSTRRPSGLPPGPGPALPLLGHLYLLDKDSRPQIHKWRRQYGDVFSLYIGGRLVVVLCGYDVIREALVKRADVFSDRPDTFAFKEVCQNRGITGTSGWRSKEQRKVSLGILRELGMGKNVLAEKIQEEVTQYIKALNSFQGEVIDIGEMTNVSVSNNICSVLFGKRFEYDDPSFKRYLTMVAENLKTAAGTAILNFIPWLKYVPGDLFDVKKVLAKAADINNTFLKPLLDSHRKNHSDGEASDFIHAYIREIHKRRDTAGAGQTAVDEANLQQLLADFFFAGSETTTSAIRWALLFFLHNPDVQDKCFEEIQRVVGTECAPSMRDRSELTYVEATIMEVLRRANLTPLSVQHCTACDVNFRGYLIPKGTIILPVLESVLHDPDVWEDPLVFNPARFIGPDGKMSKPEEFIPFGLGRRQCVGKSLARMELFLYLSTMIQHFRFLPPEDGRLPSLCGTLGLTHSPQPFKVRVISRKL